MLFNVFRHCKFDIYISVLGASSPDSSYWGCAAVGIFTLKTCWL